MNVIALSARGNSKSMLDEGHANMSQKTTKTSDIWGPSREERH
jgi:hypothetical protein